MNKANPENWKRDVALSVDMYNRWFMDFAPSAFRDTRVQTTKSVEETLRKTKNLGDISPALLIGEPGCLPSLRMSTCPPLAVDRLVGLSGASKNLIGCKEAGRLPKRMLRGALDADMARIASVIERMADPDIFPWVKSGVAPTEAEIHRAATIVADRLCGSVANPIIRNAQEKRQLAAIQSWLDAKEYIRLSPGLRFDEMPPGSYSFRLNVPVKADGAARSFNIPIDAVVKPHTAEQCDLPLMVEAKSAGDFTNTNKRRKEEAFKVTQLRTTYGPKVQFILFLCGYFDSGYLGYEAAEGIDWVWEHRIDDD